jgi:hypothetical protein
VSDEASGSDDLGALVRSRLEQYVDLWGSAGAKLTNGTYHAEDLVDDWFRWLGMVARDSTAAATLIVGRMPGVDRAARAGGEPGS